MKQLKSKGYYSLQGQQQYELYQLAEDAHMWQKTLAGLLVIVTAFALVMTVFYSTERQNKESEVRKANERVLLMVEQLKSRAHASQR